MGQQINSIPRMESAMRQSWLLLVGWVFCGGIMASRQDGHAADPTPESPGNSIIIPPSPLPPTDPMDIAARADLGTTARGWGFAGAFTLTEKGTMKRVALYWSESSGRYPNHFSLHAATKDQRGKWVSQTVYSCTRCIFRRVLERGPSTITVELQPNFEVYVDPQMSEAEQEEWFAIAERANAPFTLTISIKDGQFVVPSQE